MTSPSDESLLPVIRAALDQTRSAACITTAQLDRPGPEIVYVNQAYCRMTGRRAEDVLGKTPRIMQGPLTSRAVLDRLRADLGAGRPFVGETVNYHHDGRPYLISWRIDPVLGPEGVATHFVATQQDITRIRRAERLLAAERSIDRSVSTLLSMPADTRANLHVLAADIRSAIAGLSDYGEVAVRGSIRLGTSSMTFGAGPDVGPTDPEDDGPAAPDRTVEERFRVSCSLANERTGVDGSIVIVGLDQASLDFTDRTSLERATESAQRALDSLAEYERQRLVAIELQRSLMPDENPVVEGIELSARYQPGAFATTVGGDWYDVFTSDERIVLVVGDLAGSGVRAAADMGRVRVFSQVLLAQGAPASEVLAAVNGFCSDEDLVATVLVITIDRRTGGVEVVAAGHPPPVVKRARGAEIISLRPGPLLGIGGSARYEPQPLAIDEDDIVVMFTDGLVEEPTETIDTSLRRFAASVDAIHGGVDEVCDLLVAERLVAKPADDIAILAFRLEATFPGA